MDILAIVGNTIISITPMSDLPPLDNEAAIQLRRLRDHDRTLMHLIAMGYSTEAVKTALAKLRKERPSLIRILLPVFVLIPLICALVYGVTTWQQGKGLAVNFRSEIVTWTGVLAVIAGKVVLLFDLTRAHDFDTALGIFRWKELTELWVEDQAPFLRGLFMIGVGILVVIVGQRI